MARLPAKIAGLAVIAALSSLAPARAERDGWQRILAYFKEKGPGAPVYTPADDHQPDSFAFADVRGERTQPHKADYIALRGYVLDGGFTAAEVRIVSEDWREFKPEFTGDERAREACAKVRCLYVDQWQFTTALDGTKTGSSHHSVIEDASNTVYGGELFGATDDEAKEKLRQLLARWARVLDERFGRKP